MTGAFLPKRALRMSAALPAGTIGACTGGAAFCGVGHCGTGARPVPAPKPLPGAVCCGVIKPVEGVAENNELSAGACARAACGTAKHKDDGERRPQPVSGCGDCG